MAILRRRQTAKYDPETLDLLERLIQSPLPARDEPLAPVALRSAEAQRDVALRGFLRRTWVDGLLQHAERLLLFAAVAVFLFWFIEGPLRDWLYVANAEEQPAAASRPAATAVVPTAATAAEPASQLVPLPFTTPDMAQPGAAPDDFIVPRSAPARPEAPVAPQPTRLEIPAIELDTSVKEVFVVDGAWEVAEYAAGFLSGTDLPGEGNTALAGHAGLRGAVFRDLGSLNPGDDVYLEAGGWRYQYRVRESFSVWPTQTEVLAPSESPVLTLITCTNWDTQRLVVVADLVASKPSTGA